MLQTLAGFAAVGAIGFVALAALSAWLKRGNSDAKSLDSNAKTEATPTVREELRRIWNKADVPDVMPKGVRSANRLSTADQLDDSRFDSGSHSDVGSADDGE